MKKALCALALLLSAAFAVFHVSASTPVLLAPIPQFYATDTAGKPLAQGCVFTYRSGTTTPLTTYTDSTGVTPNPNPVILSSAGNANIWIQAGQTYTFKVVSFGGSNCVSGSTRYTVNGIGGGASQLSTNVASSATPQFTAIAQNQLFTFTLTSNTVAQALVVTGVTPPSLITFQLTQNVAGGHSFTWPANVIGGGIVYSAPNGVSSQQFVWNGTNATAVGPLVAGTASIGGPVLTSLDVEGRANVTQQANFFGGISFDGTNVVSGVLGTSNQLASIFGPLTNGNAICGTGTGEIQDCNFRPAVVYSCGGTTTCTNVLVPSPITVLGSVTLGGGGTALVSGLPAFPSTYNCIATDRTAPNPVQATPTTTTSMTVTGTAGDLISYQCNND